MITIKLCGGLGNQLFQYAYGYQMAKKLDQKIVLDISWFSHQNLRSPDILKFNIRYDHVEETWNLDRRIGTINNKFINRSIRMAGISEFSIGKYNYLKETRYRYSSENASYALDNSYLDGYWQCPLYFDSVRDDLVEMYTLDSLREKVYEEGEKLKREESVAIHVRRGDYPKKKKAFCRFVSLGEEYYGKAVESLSAKTADPLFYIFSDDMEDARGMLRPFISTRVRTTGLKTDYLDEWYLMKCCRHQITGNSSFSWWPAYLNEYENKRVCAPAKYIGNDNMIPSGWIGIDF